MDFLSSSSNSLDSEVYNKIISFLYDFEIECEKNPELQIFFGSQNYLATCSDDVFFRNKDNIVLKSLTELLDEQLKLTDVINTKFVN